MVKKPMDQKVPTNPSNEQIAAQARKEIKSLLTAWKKRCGKTHADIAYDISLSESHLGEILSGSLSFGNIMPLSICLSLSSEETLKLLELYSQSREASKPLYAPLKALDRAWLATQPPQKQAGLLLRAFRVRSFKEAKQVASEIHIETPYFNEIENGGHPIPISKMRVLQTTFNLSDEELAELNRLAAPFRKPTDRMDALDAQWLADQPPEKQAGLQLRAYRVRVYKTTKEFAAVLGATEGYLSALETGASPIPSEKIAILQAHLNLSPAETNQLETLSRTCRRWHEEKRVAMRTSSTHVGTALPFSQSDLLKEPLAIGGR